MGAVAEGRDLDRHRKQDGQREAKVRGLYERIDAARHVHDRARLAELVREIARHDEIRLDTRRALLAKLEEALSPEEVGRLYLAVCPRFVPMSAAAAEETGEDLGLYAKSWRERIEAAHGDEARLAIAGARTGQ